MDLFVKSRIDRRNAQRSLPMRCLALGMPRTGTNSLREALRILGLEECYHQATLIQNPEDGRLWSKALAMRGTAKAFGQAEWDALLGHCQAVCDIPAVHFCDELIKTYPNAKVILTTRDVDEWHRSVSETIEKRYCSRLVYVMSLFDRVTWLWASPFYTGWTELFRGDFAKYGREVYHAHNASLRYSIESDRFLEYHVSQGWEPLCDFLDLPVPDQPFPKGNGQQEFHAACNSLDRSRIWKILTRAAIIGLSVVAVLLVRGKSVVEV